MIKLILFGLLVILVFVSGCSSTSLKTYECANLCAGEEKDVPYVRSECLSHCRRIYYYEGERGLDKEIQDLKNQTRQSE